MGSYRFHVPSLPFEFNTSSAWDPHVYSPDKWESALCRGIDALSQFDPHEAHFIWEYDWEPKADSLLPAITPLPEVSVSPPRAEPSISCSSTSLQPSETVDGSSSSVYVE